MFGLETVTTAVVGTIGWTTFGEGFGNLASLNYLPSGWALFPFISGISRCPSLANDHILTLILNLVTTIVQNFLAWRIYRLTNRIWAPAAIFVVRVPLLAPYDDRYALYQLSVVGCAFSFLFGIRVRGNLLHRTNMLNRKFKVIQLGLHYDSPQAVGKYLDVGPALNAQYLLYARIIFRIRFGYPAQQHATSSELGQ